MENVVILKKNQNKEKLLMGNRKSLFISLVLLAIAVAVTIGVFVYIDSDGGGNKYQVITESSKIHDATVIFINAGKADSILVMVDGKNYLIDTGVSDSASVIKNVFVRYGVEKLDGVFLTHTHKDHIGGLKKIAKDYDIDMVYSADISMNENDGTNRIEKAVDKNGLKLSKLSAGDRVRIADKLYMEVIAPLEYNKKDDNDNSLVLRLLVNGKVFLFTGDMQFAEEQTLLDAGTDVSADVLKVGNHGNPDATSEQFAKAVNPEIAVITTDTSVDTDSANERVKKLFSKVLLTQDYKFGIKITVDKDGNLIEEEA